MLAFDGRCWCPEVGLGIVSPVLIVVRAPSEGRSTASRGEGQDLGMSRSEVFAIRVGYVGEGGTAPRELPPKER